MIIVLGAIATYLIGLAVWVYVWGYVAGKNGKRLFDPNTKEDRDMAREEWWALAGFIWPAIAPLILAVMLPYWFIVHSVSGAEKLFDVANKASLKVHERKLELESPEVQQTSLTKQRTAA